MVDVIVVGAGCTGLLYAERLSRNFEVAVVEKRDDLSTDKSWWVPKKWLQRENLAEYITNEIRKIGVSCRDWEVISKLPAGDICACIDENRFFEDYVKSIESN